MWNINDWNIDNWYFINDDITKYIKNHLVMIIVILCLILIVLYVVVSVFLNKFNRIKYKKGTWMAWVPVFNIYLLGKLTINRLFGFLLVIALFVGGSYSITLNGVVKEYELIPKDYQSLYNIIYFAVIVTLYVYAHIKYRLLIRKVGVIDYEYSSLLENNETKKETPSNEPVKSNTTVNSIYDVNSTDHKENP